MQRKGHHRGGKRARRRKAERGGKTLGSKVGQVGGGRERTAAQAVTSCAPVSQTAVCVCVTLRVLVCHTLPSAAPTPDTRWSAGVAEDRTAVRAGRESRLSSFQRDHTLSLFALTWLFTFMISRPRSYTHIRPLTGERGVVQGVLRSFFLFCLFVPKICYFWNFHLASKFVCIFRIRVLEQTVFCGESGESRETSSLFDIMFTRDQLFLISLTAEHIQHGP